MLDVLVAVIIGVAAVLVVLAVQAFTDILHAWEDDYPEPVEDHD